ncbi:DUF7565 family protein [Natrialba sp. SSL1]|uniref:DUF7565 family protein n=1 Tax=Natrialba sp. SSL1 TaxID=1869245 RepID=UPI0008F8EA87|nr:hypothetical protein [Natrialba sp. SSL1]OIB55838.1 hypothetical protein BBD46_20195 [Natrialba sp. SSL1]
MGTGLAWECEIDGCGEVFADIESAVTHQATAHDHLECEICDALVPDGYLAIRHTFTEHSRAEYVRAYGANSADVREREELLETVADVADPESLGSEVEE